MQLTLRKHQIEALEFLGDKPAAALFYEMGLGKTLIMYEHLKRISDPNYMQVVNDDCSPTPNRLGSPFPVLVVGPLSGVSVWEREAEKFGYDFKITALTGTAQERLKKLQDPADIYVINYEGLRIIKRQLIEKKFNTVICDESHRIANRGTQQTEVASALCQQATYKYLLTGTPITKSPEDVWSQFQAIVPGYLGNYWVFRNRYIDFRKVLIRVSGGGHREIKKAVRFKHLDELNQRMNKYSMRRTKIECLDLPEKIYKQIPCPLTKEQTRHYFSLKTSLGTLIKDKNYRLKDAVALMQKLQQICQGFIYNEESGTVEFSSGKREVLLDLLKDIDHEKIILFTWFRQDTENLTKLLKEKGYNVIAYEGSSQKRSELEHQFQTSKEPVIFLSNIERAKESITLTAAKHVIYYGNSWNYASRVQSEDRAHRIGQKGNVLYYDLVVLGTVDELIYKSLKQKSQVADKVTGDTERIVEMMLKEGL